MFIRKPGRRSRAFSLVEVMIATGLAGIVAAVLAMVVYFTSRSFVASTNYTDMALLSRMALDNMSRTIRQCRQVSDYATNSITLLDASGNSVQFAYNPSSHSLVSISGGATNTYLSGCNALEFWLYQRTPKSNNFTCYDPAFMTNAKLVQVTWSCSRQIFGMSVNNEVVESASICLRNH
jgi:hypothetical protein